ncbi:hypothetical protein MMC11_007386 [Xylographa trunciseda]|nr:hypothetical protein [Xylographa trunciseda]
MYANWTHRTCKENGFIFQLRNVDREELEEHILAANQDDSVDGIDQYLQQIVDFSKDVEGLCHQYVFNMYQNIRFLDEQQLQKSLLPCTPLAVIKILEYLRIYNEIIPYGNRLFGHFITIVNRSEVVGRPLAALLANDGACVYSVDITGIQQFTRGDGIKNKRHDVIEKKGWTLEDCVPLSDVIISGVPGESYKFPVHLLREGAVCINISSEKNFDPDVKDKASIYVPSIGKTTIAVLLRNLVRLVENRQKIDLAVGKQYRSTEHFAPHAHINKPKSARTARILAKRAPLPNENPKIALFLRSIASSSLINALLTDLHSLKRPLAIRFTKKNPIHPFEDASSLEFFSEKNDASLLCFGSHSKKRPHCLTFVRCFGGKVLEMMEGIVQQGTARTLSQFGGAKCRVGTKPLLSFSGTQFDEDGGGSKFMLAKSMFIDFFRGGDAKEVDVEGLQWMISFAAAEEFGEGEKRDTIYMRCWRLVTKRSGQRLPRVEVEEMGPRVDFRLGRVREADEGLLREAQKRARTTEVREIGCSAVELSSRIFSSWSLIILNALLTKSTNKARLKKNVETDIVGDKMGRIHLGRQALDELQARKMKGLKRSRHSVAEDDGAEEAEDVDILSRSDEASEYGDNSGKSDSKRPRLDS